MEKISFDPNKAYDLVTDRLQEWLNTAIKMLPNLVMAILILLAFVLIGKVIRRFTDRLLGRVTDNQSLQSLASSVMYVIVIAIGTFIALSVLNLDGAVTSLLAGAGVIGLALGFAFQDIAANFISGTMMSVRKPFNEQDLIETKDYFGVVQKIHLRTTELKTLQGQQILIPNSEVFKNPIINYTRWGKRRVDLSVGVTYDTDLPFAKKIAKEAVEALEGIDSDNITIFYTEFGGSSINFTIRYWINFSNSQAVYFEALDKGVIAIKKAFDENDITIPFPIRTLDVGDVDFAGIFESYRHATPSSDKQLRDSGGGPVDTAPDDN